MEKIVKFCKKIGLIFLLIIPIFFISIKTELIVGDELWNFQNVMKMINGGKIYIDNNVIITPIFYILGTIILKAVGANLLAFRIYNVIIFLNLILSSFLIFKSLKLDNLKSILYTLIILLFLMPYISVSANYNVLAISFYLIRNSYIFKQR